MMGIEPITRKEMFMASAAGESVSTPTPVTREEYFLSKIGGGGGTQFLPTETWTFILDDGSTVTKKVVIGE